VARSVTLGIKIQVQGQEKVIKNVQELEQEIEKLSAELKTLDFGSEEFKNASDNLGKLKAGLRDVDKEIEGVDREQSIQAFSAAINGVTGAFLIASSAARTFGADAETVEAIQQKEQAALEAVNIALGVQALAEAAVQRQKIIGLAVKARDFIATQLNTAAQTAYTVAVGASTGALRAFRIALATTGVGALVVGLGFLVSKLFETKEETEELNENLKTLKDFQLEATVAANNEEQAILQLKTAFEDSNTTVDEKKELYKELQKLVPELSNLTYDQADAEDAINTAINTQITLIRLRAKQKALEDFITQQEKTRLETEAATRAAKEQSEAIADIVQQTEDFRRAQAGGFAGTFEEYQKLQESYQNLGRELAGLTDSTDEQTQANEDLTEEERQLLEVNQEIAEQQALITKRTTTRTKATEDQTEADKAAAKAVEEYAKKIADLASAFAEISFEGEVSVKVLEDANDIIEKQNEVLSIRGDILKSQTQRNKEFNEELKNLFGGLVVPTQELYEITDTFQTIFQLARERIEDLGEKDVVQQQKIFKEILATYDIEKLRAEIGDESLDTLLDYFQTSVDIVNTIKQYNAALTETDLKIKGIKNENLDVNSLVLRIAQIEKNRLGNLQTRAEAEQEINDLVLENLFGTTDTVNLSEEQLKIANDITGTLKEQANVYLGIASVNKELTVLTGKIDGNIKSQQEKLKDTKAIEEYIKQNKDRVDIVKEFFSTLTDENSNLTEEQLENINKLIEGVEFDSIADKAAFIATQIAQIFTQISGQISSIVRAQNSLALEQLQYQEEQTLASIGNATEDAAAEQERARKKFAKQRFEVEKSSRVSELQFSIADAIANGAASVVRTYAQIGYPFGIPAALAVGAITAAQIATINSQLQFTKSKQFVGRRGGLLVGNSHENGGIMANGGLVLEGGEAVINRNAVSQFSDILSQMSMSTGGRPLVGDDSRIVEEIRRQNQRPIKTYVLDRDIQNTRKINDRLSQLARL
jgi:hypothetical protein